MNLKELENNCYPLKEKRISYEDYLYRKRASATAMVEFLMNTFPNLKSVIDLGCGCGAYLWAFKQKGVHDMLGVDIEFEHQPSPEVTYCIRTGDLSKPFDAGRLFDMALSIEVAEHINEKDVDTYITNVIRHSSLVLFSSASPYMTRDPSHKSMKHASEWISLFNEKGYSLCLGKTLDLRGWLPMWVEWWIPRNVLIFERK